MLKKVKIFLAGLAFGLVVLLLLWPKKDPRASFVTVSVLCRQNICPYMKLDSQNIQRFLPAVCVDKKRRYFVMSNVYFALTQCDSTQVWFSDGSSTPAQLVFNDEDAGVAVVQADAVPENIKALPVGQARHADSIDGYHFCYSKTSTNIAKKRIALPQKTFYEFGLWDSPGFAPETVFVDANNNTLVGLYIMNVGNRSLFVRGDHIAYILNLLQKKPDARMSKPRYIARGIETHYLEQVGSYSQDIDRALSAPGDNAYAHNVFIVVQGDDVFEEGDIMKYRHVDQQGDVAYWGGPNKREDTSDRVKVLRRGQVIELRSSAHPVENSRYNYKDRAIFSRAGLFVRSFIGWPKRHVWFCSLKHPDALGGDFKEMFDKVNGRNVETVEELAAVLNTSDPVVFFADECYTMTPEVFALPGATAYDVTQCPAVCNGGAL